LDIKRLIQQDLSIAKGDYIAMMDGDLQDPPALIEKMMEELKSQKFDIVFGKRTDRQEGLFEAKNDFSFSSVV
jgi:glycosyltransferase involved in cell wall biosynthesis